MSMLTELERKIGPRIPDNLTNILVIGQVLAYILTYTHPEFSSYFYVSGKLLFQGQVWRIVTVLFAPISGSLLFAILALYLFYLFGNELETRWGSFRYLLYILISFIGIIVFAFLFPELPVTNIYLYTSLFLAFAYLYPDFRLLLFFIIPVKIKWLAYFAWAGLIITFIFGSLLSKVLILLSISNFVVFFFSDIRYTLLSLANKQFNSKLIKSKPHHMCAVCGENEIDNPQMEIRYCNQCNPTTCYCGEHSKKHQHKRIVN